MSMLGKIPSVGTDDLFAEVDKISASQERAVANRNPASKPFPSEEGIAAIRDFVAMIHNLDKKERGDLTAGE